MLRTTCLFSVVSIHFDVASPRHRWLTELNWATATTTVRKLAKSHVCVQLSLLLACLKAYHQPSSPSGAHLQGVVGCAPIADMPRPERHVCSLTASAFACQVSCTVASYT